MTIVGMIVLSALASCGPSMFGNFMSIIAKVNDCVCKQANASKPFKTVVTW